MLSRILAFRPASVVDRLGPGSAACPLSTRELLAPARELGLVLPAIQAPVAAVARGALVAAAELQSALGLALPPGVAPEPWFDAVAEAADEVAARVPLFLSAEVIVAGEAASQVERAFHEAWRLVSAGLTHLAIDATAVAPGERGRVIGEIAEAGTEHGICVDVVVPLAEGARARGRLSAMLEEIAGRGAPADVVSLRCPVPAGAEEARLQAAALARVCQSLGEVQVMRRGAATSAALEALRGTPVRVCEDGGAAAARAVEAIPPELVQAEAGGDETRSTALERAVARLSGEAAERLEARAYVDALDFMERLGTRGSAPALARALEQRLEER